ncbi:MAG: hypothetical protein HZC23_02555 [Rhodocyclales bacterium]|nr:hypothetical protein [Rhodocyclales bacterium]
MYFWRIQELKSKLKVAPLTEREVLPYFIVYLLIVDLVSYIPSTEALNHWDYANMVFSVFLTIFGTVYLYRLNRGNDGAFFIQRYLAVGWVTVIRVIAATLPLFIVLGIYFEFPSESNIYSFCYFSLVGLVFYQRTGSHIREIAASNAANLS